MKFTNQGDRRLYDEFDRFGSGAGGLFFGGRGCGEGDAKAVYDEVQVRGPAGK